LKIISLEIKKIVRFSAKNRTIFFDICMATED